MTARNLNTLTSPPSSAQARKDDLGLHTICTCETSFTLDSLRCIITIRYNHQDLTIWAYARTISQSTPIKRQINTKSNTVQKSNYILSTLPDLSPLCYSCSSLMASTMQA